MNEQNDGRTIKENAAPIRESRISLELESADGPSFDEWLQQQNGKWVVIDFWATWCPPCVEKFPKFVTLSRKFVDQEVLFASFSMDELDDVDKVRTFLADQQVNFPNFIKEGSTGKIFEHLGLSALPEIRIYHPSGAVFAKFNGEFSVDDVQKALVDNLNAGNN
ncbi:MAG TPA: TlpA disulfide reductase family protein [Pirellulaceae bacterium]|nr:TlpA disulfide reductase family protein [Pirellulaceae bacterium]HMO90662.1 TlpA disulfide reductase family protein [Pirellulaceae bacterium]HMP67759.1 TlpA disulfide reductase family protein [Pirellulaceae bacterium]